MYSTRHLGPQVACATFNLGAALATLATQRELRAAAELYQQAAGAFGAVRAAARAATWLGGGTTDLGADCLHTLERLMLAQVRSCRASPPPLATAHLPPPLASTHSPPSFAPRHRLSPPPLAPRHRPSPPPPAWYVLSPPRVSPLMLQV